MKIIRSKYIYILPENDYEYSKVKSILEKNLTYENPKFKIRKNNKTTFFKESKYIVTFKETSYKDKKAFQIMRGNKFIYDLITEEFNNINYQDQRASFKIKINSNSNPRDEEQENAIKTISMDKFGYGILSSPPGSGKTFMASQLISIFKERTLILVDMNLLIEQFIDSLLTFTDIKENEIGIIRGSEADYDLDKKVIISTMQTLVRKKKIMKELSNNIGFIIQDECQIASCDTIQEILKEFYPKYQLGLSGTPFRDDKMDFLIREAIGPIIFETNKEKMIKKGNLIVPILRPIFLKDDKNFEKYNLDETEFRDVVDVYYNNENTIKKISSIIVKMFDERSQLVVCKEKQIVNKYYYEILTQKFPNILKKYEKIKKKKIKELKEKYEKTKSEKEKERFLKDIKKIEKETLTETKLLQNDKDFETVKIITGELKKDERNKIIENANSGKIKVLITTNLLDKAISINRLDTLHLLFSTREVGNTIQRIGRISRSYAGKNNAIVFDYIYDHYMSFYQFFNRKGNYRILAHKESCKIHPSILSFINYLQKRYIEKDMYVKIEEYEKYKHLYELDINKEVDNEKDKE